MSAWCAQSLTHQQGTFWASHTPAGATALVPCQDCRSNLDLFGEDVFLVECFLMSRPCHRPVLSTVGCGIPESNLAVCNSSNQGFHALLIGNKLVLSDLRTTDVDKDLADTPSCHVLLIVDRGAPERPFQRHQGASDVGDITQGGCDVRGASFCAFDPVTDLQGSPVHVLDAPRDGVSHDEKGGDGWLKQAPQMGFFRMGRARRKGI
mmetsp:Transcript_64204/g.134956  ORF Transcript_64204/g.134956 Transcript_64204/m.134956 type:complete len:207 (-) Transcript_64204:125-745(-)